MASEEQPTEVINHYFNPAEFLLGSDSGSDGDGATTVLVVLNLPIAAARAVLPGSPEPVSIFETVWNHCKYRVCADGGANRLYEYFRGDKTRRAQFIPDFIAGDLDSARPKVVRYYAARGTEVFTDEDQYSTDLMKCVKIAQEKWFPAGEGPGGDTRFKVVALGGLGGRVDQSFHSLHHLYISQNEAAYGGGESAETAEAAARRADRAMVDPRYHKNRATVRHDLALLSVSPTHANLTILLPASSPVAGRVVSHIQTPRSVLGPAVGLIPLSGRTALTTSGLVYDIERWPTEFGGQVSTSNYLAADAVRVESSAQPIVFTVEIKQHREAGNAEESSEEE